MTLPTLTTTEFYSMDSPQLPEEFILKDPLLGTREWHKFFISKTGWKKPELHRLNGPARIDKYGSETWYKRGYLHRIGGPAIIDRWCGDHEWWIMGKEITSCERYQQVTGCSGEDILVLKLKWGDIK